MGADMPTSLEVRAERVLPVPARVAYAAWTEPAQVRGWWGPTGFSCPVAELDVRVGGVSLVAMRAPAEYGGGDLYNTWTYTRVVPGERLEYELRFSTPTGEPIAPADAGIPDGVPAAVPHVVTFDDLDGGRSRTTVVESGYTDAGARDVSQVGLDQCLDKLERLLSAARA